MLFQEGKYRRGGRGVPQARSSRTRTTAALRASLAGALGALGRYDESLEQLNQAIEIEPLNPEAYHNRGVIYEKQGKREDGGHGVPHGAALQPAVRAVAPGAGAAHRIGERERAARPKRSSTAPTLAERASQAARRGDYQAAMQTLDEAEQDRAALRARLPVPVERRLPDGRRRARQGGAAQALEIEPDNALFKTNLQRLEQASAK